MREPLTYVRNLLRGNRYTHEQQPHRIGIDSPPVLVLHGYLGTRGAMWLMERRLLRDGFSVYSFPLGLVNSSDIRKSARRVRDRVRVVLDEAAVERIDIVGHSMGGLIGLYYIQELGGDATVRRLVTLGTPYQGTWTSLIGLATVGLLAPSSWQL
ncbi:MAG: alpha/beta fold hydrolase, partial [Deltaproteobacteria bacterium]|nr:alpha/beta fold hydrolase [Deltaproteobacteria bacterium]